MISPFSVQAHAARAARAANRGLMFAAALRAHCNPQEQEHCASQLRAAAAELKTAADLIEAKVAAREGSAR